MNELILPIMTALLCSMSVTFITERMLKYIMKPSAIYFFIHVILNSYIVYITYYDTFLFFINPNDKHDYFSPCCIKASSVIIVFHLYLSLSNTQAH